METTTCQVIHREIGLSSSRAGTQQARGAMLELNDLNGVKDVRVVDRHRLWVSYDLKRIDLRSIDKRLRERGYPLEDSILSRLKRALFYFTDENKRANLECRRDQEHSTRNVFVNRYNHTRHGCRDHRPDHWRHYL